MSTTLTNVEKAILQTSFPPQGLFHQMYDEENGKEKGKKEDVKHCPEVEKKVSPAFRCPPWFFSYLKKRAVPSWVEQVIYHWVTDELRKNSLIHRFTQWAEFELANAFYLSEESLIGDVTINNVWLHQFQNNSCDISVTHSVARHVPPFCSCHILTSSVI